MERIIITIAALALLTGSATAWAINLAYKWGIVEWLQVNAPCELLYKLFSCDYCMSWWVSVCLTVVAVLATQCWWCVFIPFASTMVSLCLLTRR